MTNTTYFHTVRRDPYSSSSSSSTYQSPETSHRHITQQENGAKAKDSRRMLLKFKEFSFEELKNATNNFYQRDSESDFNRVFKGWIDKKLVTTSLSGSDSIAVTIKFLYRQRFQDCHGWVRHVQRLAQLSHPSLVRYFGYCLHQDRHLLLVSELMPRNLEDHLFNNSIVLLPWSLRMRVALGTAEGLAFLHRNRVLYHNFGISNVLLDTNYNAKLTDLGIFDDRCKIPMVAKEDVYSFGVLLLEILSGRSKEAVEIIGKELVGWAMPYLEHNSLYVLDRRLKGQYSLQNAPEVVNLAYRCLNREAKLRPSMDEVVAELRQVQDSLFMEIIINEAPLELEQMTHYEIVDMDTETDMYMDTDTDTDTEDQASEWLISEGR